MRDSEKEAVLGDIDKLVQWERESVAKLETGLMRLAALLVESRQGEYWTVRGLACEEDYIKSVFPQSRATYYALIGIGERLLPHYPRRLLEDLGRSKCEDLVRIQRKCGLVPESWFIHAAGEDKDTFRRRVRSYLTAARNGDSLTKSNSRADEPEPEIEDEFITFRVFGDGISVVRRALELARRMLGSDRSYGHCLESICADFLSGAYSESGKALNKNGFLLMLISNAVAQMDMREEGVADRLIGTIAAAIEKHRVQESP